MQRRIDITNLFIKKLVNEGYPTNSIVVDYRVKNVRADVAVIDPVTKEPIAIYEIKKRSNAIARNIGFTQLHRFLEECGDPNIPAFLVTYTGASSDAFVIEQIYTELDDTSEESESDVSVAEKIAQVASAVEDTASKNILFDKGSDMAAKDINLFSANSPEDLVADDSEENLNSSAPNFDALINRKSQVMVEEKKEEKIKAFDSFKLVCWILAALILVLFSLDLLFDFELNERQLFLLGIVVCLVLVPFASKLKVAGIEFERVVKKRE